jgi:Domain of unknown function (DUF4258)
VGVSIKYTRHAKNRMRLYKITEAEVELAIQQPEHLAPSIEGRLNAWREILGYFLRVTYKEEENRYLVISAVRKKRGWR